MNPTTATTVPPDLTTAAAQPARRSPTVVAVVVVCRGRVALLRRRTLAGGGEWDCVSADVEEGSTTEQQALGELHRATGLGVKALDSLEAARVLTVRDGGDFLWELHIYCASTRQRRLTLGWKHDAYRWVEPQSVRRFGNRTAMLDEVLAAVELCADPQQRDGGVRPIPSGRRADRSHGTA